MPSISSRVEVKHRAVVVEGAAAFQAPRAGDRGDAACRMHVDRAVARARKSIAQPKICALVLADELGECFDRFHGRAGDLRRPLRIARAQMRGEFARRVGVAVEIIPIRFVVAEQAMHHRAGKRAIGTRPDQHRQVGLPHGPVHVDIDGDDLGAALLAGARGMGHHIDLGVHRIGAPDHDQIGFRHLARIGAGEAAGAGDKSGPGRIDADGGKEAGILLGVAQAVDAVTHHIAHRPGIKVRPDRFRAVRLLGASKLLGDEIERVVPGDRAELPAALRAGSAQRLLQPVWMVHPLRIARDLGADDARRVVVVLSAADAADRVVAKDLDLERAGRWAIVRTGRCEDPGANGLIHRGRSLSRSGCG